MSSRTADTVIEDAGSPEACNRAMLDEGSSLPIAVDLTQSEDDDRGGASEDLGTRFDYLWREPARAATGAENESRNDAPDPNWWRDPKGDEPPRRQPVDEDEKPAPIPLEILRNVLEQIEDDGEPNWQPSPFFLRRETLYDAPPTLYRGGIDQTMDPADETDSAADEDFAHDSDKGEVQAIELMNDTVEVSPGQLSEISSEVAHQRSLAIMERGTEGRKVQGRFPVAARRQVHDAFCFVCLCLF